MVSGSIQIINKRIIELWSMLMGLRCCLYAGKHKVILETEFGDAVREWEGWRNFIDPTHAELIRSLVHRTDDERLKLEICVVKQSRNQLARYLAEDGAVNRTMPVIFTHPFGRVRDLWHRDLGLGTT